MDSFDINIIKHNAYLLSLAIKYNCMLRNEDKYKSFYNQLFINEKTENPFTEIPVKYGVITYTNNEVDDLGENKVSPQGELLGGRKLLLRKVMKHNNDKYICQANELSELLNINKEKLKDPMSFNLHTELHDDQEWFYVKDCFMRFGASIIVKGIRIKDDYYESKMQAHEVTHGFRAHRIPDNILKRSKDSFDISKGNVDIDVEGYWPKADNGVLMVDESYLGTLPIQTKPLKYINKVQLTALKNNNLMHEKLYEVWNKNVIINQNDQIKSMNIGNIWRLDNMLKQDLDDAGVEEREKIDSKYYNPDGFANTVDEITQLKDNILNLTTRDILELQNKHFILKSSSEINKVRKNRQHLMNNKYKKLNSFKNTKELTSEISKEYYQSILNLVYENEDDPYNVKNLPKPTTLDPLEVEKFLKSIMIKDDRTLIELTNNKKSTDFWSFEEDHYDELKRSQTVDIEIRVPNRNVYEWFKNVNNPNK